MIFDPATAKAPATKAQPMQYPVGIEYVIVNGQVVIERDEKHGRAARPRAPAGPGPDVGTDIGPVPPSTPPFEQLDFIYMPSRDVAADLTWFEGVLGGRVVFAIEDGGTASRWSS